RTECGNLYGHAGMLKQQGNAGSWSCSGGSFVNDLPRAAFLHPVLALAHAVGEIAAGVVLIESNDGEPLFAGIQEHADFVELDLHPLFARIDLPFLLRESSVVLRP